MHRMGDGQSRRSQLLRGVLDLCLLAVIDEEPAYGYEMLKRLRNSGLSVVGEGSVYPLLARLEREGLVTTYRAPSNGGPPRKYYRTSVAGRRALADGIQDWQLVRSAVDGVLPEGGRHG
jgi:PadR family transcriptional regulator, regulatory protein PadR